MKILFIGLGGIGQRHLRNIQVKFGDKVSFMAYRVRNLRHTISPGLTINADEDLITKYSIKVFTDLKEAFSHSPEVVFICNPTSHHMTFCLAAAEAGCDIFVEKPLSHSLADVLKLQTFCNTKKLICNVGFQLRFHPCYELLKKLVTKEYIGNILSVHAEVGEYLPDWHKYEDYRVMYASRKEMGGGVVLSQIHEIDYLYDLFGMPDRVFAMGGHLSNLEVDVEDVADVLMEISCETRRFPISLHLDYIQRPPSRNCKVVGDSGKIYVDFTWLKVTVEKPEKDIEVYDFSGLDRNELFTREIDHFFDCIKNRRKPMVSLDDGINSLKIALAIKESIESGSVLKLKHIYGENSEFNQLV